ncbi:M56 family metallopeptidase [Clostridium formicaceticum]|uniref:Methicillin resistance mecR1 protein n=1 Tax=Clostridium formicaceticum TaxID=1497 RepID=A0AAC9WG48_9CLOT|nr:M56 family metallopeptidase [Clostridium formicaceticum]AOY77026.1 hypothetical protein BJL90_14900 [Clostridium formicaceticum]ARE87523.1 Methicillin resistance mecR1 protein [Clostridium formicaceticum]
MAFFLQELFLSVMNMSITASYVILFVMVGRLFLKKTPKIFSYTLWAVVLFRLVSPFSFSSAFSFLKAGTLSSGKMEYIPFDIGMMGQPQIDTGISGANAVINHSLPAATPYASTNPMQMILFILSIIWILGVLILMTYSFISYLMLKRKVCMAVLLQDNIFECESISTPFVLGIVNPKIYLPKGLSEIEKSYILKHEQIHIRRFDYLIKPCAFLALCVHWFNPFVWLSFVLMSHDMEMSCDERVIKELGTDIKKDYSTSILSLAVNRKMVNGSPLAFGETGAKGRIKNVLNYKRPAFWVSIVTVIAVAAIGIGLVSNPNASIHYKKEKIHMAEIWAEGLKTRDGKLRYEIMSEDMKEKFIVEQKAGSEEWYYNIGYSSPWVVNYEIEVEGDTANIIYYMTDSDGEIYEKTEIITFGKENNQFVIINAREKFAHYEVVRYFAATARGAMETYTEALLESDYPVLLSLVHTENFDPIGQDIWDTVKIDSVKVINEDVRENKACYGLELDIKDGGSSAFEAGVFPRWLWLVKGEGESGWYVEGLMTSGEPDASWWGFQSEQIDEIDMKDLTEKLIITSDRYNNTKYPLIAELSQEGIYLYGINSTGSGVVLKYGENIQVFDWIYTTTRFILPVLEKYDVDDDGKDEIMCVLNVGSGTGLSVYELHILKFDKTAGYIDYAFSDYIEQIKTMFSFTYNENENSILLKTKNDSYTYVLPKEYQELTFKDITYGDIVYFYISDGLEINILPAMVAEEVASPLFLEDIILKGDIRFKDGEFQITSLQIVAN